VARCARPGSPLTRHPLGGKNNRVSTVAIGILSSAFLLAMPRSAAPPGCYWQEIPEIQVAIAVPEGWRFRELPKKGGILLYEVVPAGTGAPEKPQSRYELRFQRIDRAANAPVRARDHVSNAVAASVQDSPVDEQSIGVMTSYSAVGYLSPDSSGVPQLIVAALAIGNAKTGALYTIRFEIPSSEAEAVLPMGNVLFRTIVVDDEV
jgi:hypothetical protein